MCRSALEYPPSGKRCAGANHLAMKPAEYDAWRLKRNARERELYHLRKKKRVAPQNQGDAEKAEEAESIFVNPRVSVDPTATIRERLQYLSTSPDLITGEDFNYNTSTAEQAQLLRNILASEQSDFAYFPIKKQDTYFYGWGVNTVERFILEDGSVGYFKHFKDNGNQDSYYGLTTLSVSLNEVAAYRLSQIMGEGYDDLVPETVLTEHRGQLGTLQREAEGAIGDYDVRRPDHYTYGELDEPVWRRAAILDSIMGALDRHEKNFIVDRNTHPRLIDNGFGFPEEEEYYPGSTDITEGFTNSRKANGYYERKQALLTKEERKAVLKLQKSPKLIQMREVLSEVAYEHLLIRIHKVLEEGIYSS